MRLDWVLHPFLLLGNSSIREGSALFLMRSVHTVANLVDNEAQHAAVVIG